MDASIIIPTYNGGDLLGRTLSAVFAQKTVKVYEVIIIDSGSDGETKKILREYPVILIEIDKSQFNHGLTRDHAASMARGEYLLFINQDAEPGDEHWLDLMIQPMLDDEAVVATQGGIMERNDMPRFFWDSCGERFYFTSESKGWIARYHSIGFSTVNCAIRRSVWEKNRFGSMAFAEDKNFQRRVHVRGHEIVSARGWVYHTHDYDYRQLRDRCLKEGYGWRLVDENYSFRQAVRDTMHMKNYRELLHGVLKRRITRWSEFVFPFMRPFWVYRGNHRGI
jgi:rhamnosyltransferase